MTEAGYLIEVIVILLSAVVFVLLFRRLGLGAVLGYLAAGTAIGPTGLGLIPDFEATSALAELGVVFLLFMVGLELPLERIRLMRPRVFWLGAAQVLITAAAVAGIAVLLGLSGTTAAVIGGGLALSSTAIVLRLLAERGQIASRFGRSAFAILLVQDLAVGPFLVVVLALGQENAAILPSLGLAGLKVMIALLLILGLGRIVLRHVFWPVAAIREPEIFTALTLLVVLLSATMTRMAGLSMAFGAFLAGMLLAETHYRHQVGAVIQPFRGLLLGLFFMTVGMQIDLELTLERAGVILLLVLSLVTGKAALIAGIARLFGQPWAQSLHLGILLAQAGEFAFVLFGAAGAVGLLPAAESQVLIVAVALSMVATPFLAWLGERISRRIEQSEAVGVEESEEAFERLRDHVVIAGFGRVGAAAAASLEAAQVPYIAVDVDPARIAAARQRGLPVYFGDISLPEILVALHVERARSLVVALDNPKTAVQLVALVSYIFPDLMIYARARDEGHARELEELGAHSVVPEMVATGKQLAGSVLEGLVGRQPGGI